MVVSSTFLWIAFVLTTSLVLLIVLLVDGRKNRLNERIRELSDSDGSEGNAVAQLVRTSLPKMGAPLLPDNQEQRTLLQTRLVLAGLYGRQAMAFYLGVKMVLIVSPALIGLLAGLAGLLPVRNGLIFGALIGVFGLIGPSFWLDRRKRGRQTLFRRALPDALDVLVICLEGGLSMPAAVARVANELRTAHPELALELGIVEREVQMGRTMGDAMRQFAERTDLEEIRSLASVIVQGERYGVGLVKALRVHAEALRTKRLQYAEEMAQKAAIKILFPTLLFIFPGIFIVVLAPAVIMLMRIFAEMHRL